MKSIYFVIIFILLTGYSSNILTINSEIKMDLKQEITIKPNVNPKNVILMIGDGMGYEQVKLARWVEVGKTGNLTMDTFPHKFSSDTNNLAGFLTDSAAGATAIATGSRTYNSKISQCWDGSNLKTIVEIAQELGLSTGIVTTTTIVHATPAAFAAHDYTRYNEENIALQLINSGVDVFFGGGEARFYGKETLIANAGYSIVTTKSQMDSATGKVWGFFASGHLEYEQNRLSYEPSIKDMTDKAIELLSANPNGFFLMVEGGKIDYAGHAHNQVNAALETIAFDKAVNSAYNFAKNDKNTLVLVTADHETGGLSVVGDTLSGPLPSTGNTESVNKTARINRANQINVDWHADYHTAINVPLFGYGSLSNDYINGSLLKNTDVFRMVRSHIDLTSSSSVSKCLSTAPYWESDLMKGDQTQFKIDVGINKDETVSFGAAIGGAFQTISLVTDDL